MNLSSGYAERQQKKTDNTILCIKKRTLNFRRGSNLIFGMNAKIRSIPLSRVEKNGLDRISCNFVLKGGLATSISSMTSARPGNCVNLPRISDRNMAAGTVYDRLRTETGIGQRETTKMQTWIPSDLYFFVFSLNFGKNTASNWRSFDVMSSAICAFTFL